MIFAAATILAATLVATAPIAPPMVRLPAGTHLRFHLVRPLTSDKSRTGQPFSFVLLGAISAGGQVLVNDGAVGTGTVVLAGHAGSAGHEGDLTLRLDRLPAANGSQVLFCSQQMRINGRNRKIMSGILGFIPIRGSEIRISTKTPIETVLLQPTATPPNYCPGVISKSP
jgi:hypothetical protein